MTSTDKLRERIAGELESLPPIDVTEAARADGSRRLRRRRAGAGVAFLGVAALAVGGIAVTAGGDAPRDGEDAAVTAPDAPDAPDTRDTAAAVIAAAGADGRVTEQEWLDTLDATLDALLPARFGGVDQVRKPDGLTQLRTVSDGPRFDSWISIQGYEGPRSAQPGFGGCDGLRQGAAEADFEWVIDDCADGDIANGALSYLADREHSRGGSQSDSPGELTQGAAVIVLGDDFFLEWGMVSAPEGSQITLTADEMAAVVTDPLFLDAAEVGTAYFAEREQDPRSVIVVPDPVWPL